MYFVSTGFYKHYKGGIYYVTHIAKHTETDENMVIYRSADDSTQYFARPQSIFTELITVDGKKIHRFKKALKKDIVRQ